MRLMKTWLILTALFMTMASFAAIDALAFKSIQQEKDYHSLTQELRCPQCQNNNIADSNASIAVDMRAKVFELLNEGKTRDEIVNYMVERYGNFVTYNPPLTPATLLLWTLPLCFIVFGIIFVLRRQSKRVGDVSNHSERLYPTYLSVEDEKRLNALLGKKD